MLIIQHLPYSLTRWKQIFNFPIEGRQRARILHTWLTLKKVLRSMLDKSVNWDTYYYVIFQPQKVLKMCLFKKIVSELWTLLSGVLKGHIYRHCYIFPSDPEIGTNLKQPTKMVACKHMTKPKECWLHFLKNFLTCYYMLYGSLKTCFVRVLAGNRWILKWSNLRKVKVKHVGAETFCHFQARGESH